LHAIEIDNLTKTFRKDESRNGSGPKGLGRLLPTRRVPARVVDSVSFTVEEGEVFGVLGPNGSGKSTLIRIISTLLLPDEGTARVFGHDVVKEADTVRRMISRVSADAAFFRQLSAMENLIHSARLYGLPVKEAERTIRELLARLDMRKDKLDAPMHELSRGMQQKVAITRAFLTSPSLLLLDEPTTGLDPRSKREVQRFIRELREDGTATVLLTTHDMEEAEILCDRIAILNKGKIAALGTAEELKSACTGCSEPRTLEAVFLTLAGGRIDESEEDGE
jgi:ABC-2 type transport system ATP-binding protein